MRKLANCEHIQSDIQSYNLHKDSVYMKMEVTENESDAEAGNVAIDVGVAKEDMKQSTISKDDKEVLESARSNVEEIDNARAPKSFLQRITERPKSVVGVLIILLVAAVGLAFGLGFGLTKDEGGDSAGGGSFAVELNGFGPEILEPYKNCSEFENDLRLALKYMANFAIETGAQAYYHGRRYQYGGGGGCWECEVDGAPVAERPVPAPGSPTFGGGESGGGEDSFLSNNQVKGVDEPDSVKSDGNHVFAKYGNEVVVWEVKTLELKSRTRIPVVSLEDMENIRTVIEEDENSIRGDSFHCYSNIAGLLLHDEQLVVIASGECSFYEPGYSDPADDLHPILSPQSTRVYVYDVSNIPTDGSPLSLMGRRDIPGMYLNGRAIGQFIHVITSSNIDSYKSFLSFVDRYDFSLYPRDLPEYEFRIAAEAMVEEKLEVFACNLRDEILAAMESSICDDIVRLALLQTSDFNETDMHELWFAGGQVLGHVTLITSFDVRDVNETSFPTSTKSLLMSNRLSTIYGSKNFLIMSSQGWNEVRRSVWDEETFLFVFEFFNATTRAVAVGSVPGYVLNQFSLDIYQVDGIDYLRVATTKETEWEQENAPQGGPLFWRPRDTSSSQVTVLSLPAEGSSSNLTIVGLVDGLGVTERIYSVRFIDLRGFVVTFRQVDPFYTIEMSDPFNPSMVGELKIPGYSSYLHPIDGSVILGVGQYVDPDEGWRGGLQISLFDVADLANPRRLQNFVDDHASSSAEYDHQAFRYLDINKVLIIPVTQWGSRDDKEEPFDGFFVYNVSVDEIAPRFSISHADGTEIMGGCWSYSNMDARSLVFDNDVMTMKRHTVLVHDIVTQEKELPRLNLDVGQDPSDCHGYYRERRVQ